MKFVIISSLMLSFSSFGFVKKASIDDIINYLRFYSEDYDRDDVTLSITFLYALGKVSYSEKTDTIKLVSEKVIVS